MKAVVLTIATVCLVACGSARAQEQAFDRGPAPAAEPPEAGVPAGEARQASPEEIQRQLTALNEKVARLERDNAAMEKLRQRVTFLERDNAALADQLRTVSEGNGRGILANLNTDPQLRQELARAANPQSVVRVYNWKPATARINVNGSWYNLPPGRPTTIPVAYGPVAVTHCDKETPKTFTDWTPVHGGFVMAFDVGNTMTPRMTARR